MYRNFSAAEVVLKDQRTYHRVLSPALTTFEKDS